MGTLSKAELELLQQMNADLPDVDWKTGARTYIQQALSDGSFAEYSLIKPFVAFTPGTHSTMIPMVVDLFRNFCSVLELLQLPAGSRVLDVACGGGWLSHYFAKMGYHALGVDICEDLLAMARKRVGEDTRLRIKPEFVLCDLEEETISAPSFRAAIFESCFHHFHNPIAVLRHVVDVLDTDGVVVLIEGECRQGGLNPQWIEEMNRYHTIERPYTRMEMIEVLRLAGLPCYEFMAPVDGWYSPRWQVAYELPARVTETARLQNRCIAARNPDALRRILPWWSPPSAVRFCEGFMTGVGNKLWCAPYGRILIEQAQNRFDLKIGGRCPSEQTITVHRSGIQYQVILRYATGTQLISFENLIAGEELHLCSDYAFKPAWFGEPDERLLSFWVEI